MDADDEHPSPRVERDAVDRRGVGTLLAIVGVLVVVLAAAFVHTDLDSVADGGWQDTGLWAAGVGAVFLGIALAILAWTVAVPDVDLTMARTAAVVAVLGVVTAVVVLGLADVRGGQRAQSVTTVSAGGSEVTDQPAEGAFVLEEPVPLSEATDPDRLTEAAFPITARTLVTLELTAAGREVLAAAMQCRPRDLQRNELLGTAVGGTWVQPLVVIGPPVDDAGALVAPCRRVAARIAPAMGFAVPRL